MVAQTCRLRPHWFAEHNGLLFDMEAADSDGLAYRGITGVLIVEKKLYLIFFLGAEPYRYDKHIDEALVVIQAAHI